MVTNNNMDDMKVEEATLRRKLDSTRDLSERRQIRALLKTLREKREQRQNDDQANNNVTSVTTLKTSSSVQRIGNKDVGKAQQAPSSKVRFANVEKPMDQLDSGTDMLALRSRRRSVAKPPPSTSFLMNKLSNVMQREKAAQSGGRPTGVNAFRSKFDNVDANNNRQGNSAPSYSMTKTSTVQTKTTVTQNKGPNNTAVNYSSTVTEKKEEQEISHPNRTALRSRRRSVAKMAVPMHVSEKPSIQTGAIEEPPKANDARFQRRLSRTRMTAKTDSKDGGHFNALGKPVTNKGGLGGSAADRMAFFRQAATTDEEKEVKPAPKPAPTPVIKPAAPAPTPQQNKENVEKPIEKIARRSPPKKKPQLKRQMSVSQLVLQWCKEQTEEYENVNITNFSASWADGLAMAALIHKFNPTLFEFTSLIPGERERNFTTAFQAAEKVGVAVLLDVEDLVRMKKPEPRSIQTQVQMIFSKYRPKDLDTSQLSIA